ncbi:hypothetical protein SARC_12535, partial [Sphaeroforma arctica JP610]
PGVEDFGPKVDGPELIIVGAGILGSSLAAAAARDGRKVVLIERSLAEPDRIVGELLQPGGIQSLTELGLRSCVDDIDAITEYGYMIYYKGETITLEYPQDDSGDKLYGKSFHHGRFIMKLREAAMKEKNVSVIEGTVTSLNEDENGCVTGVTYKTKTEEGEVEKKTISAPLTVVADGCFSKFRKQLSKTTPSVPSRFYSLELQDVVMEPMNYAIVALINPCPVLVYQIGTRETRVLVDVPENSGIDDVPEFMRNTVVPQLPEHIQGPFNAALESQQLRWMPNSYLPAAPLLKHGVLCMGDAMNMRHPLTGGGMSVAFKDVLLWTEFMRTIPDLRDHTTVRSAVRKFTFQRKQGHSFVVNVLANALYELFAASDGNLAVLRQGCFAYFQLGGECVNGPVRLLSILKPQPLVLVGHFFAVAVYGITGMLRECKSLLQLPATLVSSVKVMASAVRVIVPLTWQEMRLR